MFDGKTMENHHFSWENSLFLWPFSIAMQMFTRGYELNQPESAGEKNLCLNNSKWFVKKNDGMLGNNNTGRFFIIFPIALAIWENTAYTFFGHRSV